MIDFHIKNGYEQWIPPITVKEEIMFGASFTDPCLSWEITEELIYQAHHQFSSSLPLSLPLVSI